MPLARSTLLSVVLICWTLGCAEERPPESGTRDSDGGGDVSVFLTEDVTESVDDDADPSDLAVLHDGRADLHDGRTDFHDGRTDLHDGRTGLDEFTDEEERSDPLDDELDHSVSDPDFDEEESETVPGDCHVDCFGFYECVDGVVRSWADGPGPCDAECYYWTEHTCEVDCRTDLTPEEERLIYSRQVPSVLCTEGRPSEVGDFCDEHTPCVPWPVYYSAGGLVVDDIECDLDAQECVDS